MLIVRLCKLTMLPTCLPTSVHASVQQLAEQHDVGVRIVEGPVLGLGQGHGAEVLDPPDEEAGVVRGDHVGEVVVVWGPRPGPLGLRPRQQEGEGEEAELQG